MRVNTIPFHFISKFFCVLILLPVTLMVFAADFPAGKSYTIFDSIDVLVSEPVLAGRQNGYYWFPSLSKLANGDLVLLSQGGGDNHDWPKLGYVQWSKDGGLNWSAKKAYPYLSGPTLKLNNQDEILLPFYLRISSKSSFKSLYNVIPNGLSGQEIITQIPDSLEITGQEILPREPDLSQYDPPNVGPFVFNGDVVRLKDGRFLATVYGQMLGDPSGGEKINLATVVSSDGINWKFYSTVFDAANPTGIASGMSESGMCRMPDGRIMIVSRPHLAQVFSSDEGLTWTDPVKPYVFSYGGVEPSLDTMKGGMVVLSSGRQGLNIFINTDTVGKEWESIDILAHHNELLPQEALVHHGTSGKNYGWGTPTGYTQVEVLDDSSFLMVYDRPADDWPPKSTATEILDMDAIYLVKVTVRKAGGTSLASQSTNTSSVLFNASPNPFNPNTTLSFSFGNLQHLKTSRKTPSPELSIFSINGKIVYSIIFSIEQSTLKWNASHLPSGLYLAKLKWNGQVFQTRLVLNK